MTLVGRELKGKLIGRRIPLTPSGFQLDRIPGASQVPGASQGVVVPVNSVKGIAKESLAGKFSDDPGIRYGDGMYYLPTLEEIQFILKESQLDRRKWLENRFDCDDFAYVLKGEMSVHTYDTSDIRYGLCVGMVWGNFDWITGYHAVNWFIDSNSVMRFIEPQSDSIYDVSNCQGDISLFVA